MRIVQKTGIRGSLMYVQRLISQCPQLLDAELRQLGVIGHTASIVWKSPLERDQWAEYRDKDFLHQLGRDDVADALEKFWPTRGPQWDGLGVEGSNLILLEAKAHVDELNSSCTAKSAKSLKQINDALQATKRALGARPDADWLNGYYQLANRLAHLTFLRKQGANAWLVLLQFTGQTLMPSSATFEEYELAFQAALTHLGLDGDAPIPGLQKVYIDVADLTVPGASNPGV